MSYLNGTRLHFAGNFQAAVSTVNNDRDHFDVTNFDPSWWEFGAGSTDGWWNPPGDGAWRLIGCRVTSARLDDQDVHRGDVVIGCAVADSDRRPPAKLVDLDVDQQMVSTVFGLTVRVADPDTGDTLVGGDFEPAPFSDIWQRCPGRGDLVASAVYQSVLTNLTWGDTSPSPFLQALKDLSPDQLSICFTVDGYNGDHATPGFTLGRIVGTIGPYLAGEPHQLVLGRHFMTTNKSQGFFLPAGAINFCRAVVDDEQGMIRLDLGNALPTQSSGGTIVDLGPLELRVAGSAQPLATIDDYADDGWYERTAGVVDVRATAGAAPLEIASATRSDVSIAEATDGRHVRADRFVFRLDPGAIATTTVYATRFGTPAAGVPIAVTLDPSVVDPHNNTPADGVKFNSLITTGPDGTAPLQIGGGGIGMVRDFIDGQVYSVRPVLADTPADTVVNPSDFVSVLLFSKWAPDDPITWFGSLQPIFEQFFYLYPVMARFLDLRSYDSVCENVLPLTMAFGLPIEDPNAMPVTRDLSTAKRTAILSWLGNPDPATGKPRRGAPTPPKAQPEAARGHAARVTPGRSAAGAPPEALSDSKQRFLENRTGGDQS